MMFPSVSSFLLSGFRVTLAEKNSFFNNFFFRLSKNLLHPQFFGLSEDLRNFVDNISRIYFADLAHSARSKNNTWIVDNCWIPPNFASGEFYIRLGYFGGVYRLHFTFI